MAIWKQKTGIETSRVMCLQWVFALGEGRGQNRLTVESPIGIAPLSWVVQAYDCLVGGGLTGTLPGALKFPASDHPCQMNFYFGPSFLCSFLLNANLSSLVLT